MKSMLEIVNEIEDKDAPIALIDMAACVDLDLSELRAAYEAEPNDYLRGCIRAFEILIAWMDMCQNNKDEMHPPSTGIATA